MKRFTIAVLAAALTLGCENAQSPSTPQDPSPGPNAGAQAEPSLSTTGIPKDYIGLARAVRVTLLGITTNLVTAGPLPKSGGTTQSKSLLNASVTGLLSADVANASVDGRFQRSLSKSSLANVRLTVAGNVITAGALSSEAFSSCSNRRVGSSQTNLVINGKAIVITGQPNQTIPILLGKVVINEQTRLTDGIAVTSLHVIVNGLADVALSHAKAGVSC